MKAVLDTNFLLLPVLDGIDLDGLLDSGYTEWLVPSSVVKELQGLADGGGRTGTAAQAAIALMGRCTVEDTELPGDDGVLDVATRHGAAVATLDKRLATEATRRGLATIGVRDRRIQA